MGIFNFLKRQKNEQRTVTAEEKPVAGENVADTPVPENFEPTAPPAEEARARGEKVFVRVRYNRSFIAKLIQSDDRVKGYYGEAVNEFSRYGVKTRISWRHQTFKEGRKLLGRLAFRGKTLSLYLKLDPAAYAGTKYKIEDVSSVAKNADVPLLYKLKNDRRCKYAKDLIAAVAEANGLAAGETGTCDYAARYPYEETESLIERGLIKLLKFNERDGEEAVIGISKEAYDEIAADGTYPEVVESITVCEAEERIDDAQAEAFIRESGRVADKTKKDIVNIDALGRYFSAGETVTVEEIRKRVPAVNSKATYIKVLARGTLDKPLNIEADDFSPAAVKMIVLTGGTVSRSRK